GDAFFVGGELHLAVGAYPRCDDLCRAEVESEDRFFHAMGIVADGAFRSSNATNGRGARNHRMTRQRREPTKPGHSTEGADGSPKPKPGDVVGSYRIVEQIASGAVGWVYKVQHTGNNELFAMKVLRSRYAFDADVVSRFFLE